MTKDLEAISFLNQAAFAARRGVSRKTVTRWKQQGLLIVDADGLVDVAATEAGLDARPPAYRGGVTQRVTQSLGNKKRDSPGNRSVDGAFVHAPSAIDEETAEQLVDRIVKESGAPHSLAEAQRVKENYLALLRQLEYDRESAKVVEIVDVIHRVVGEYAIVRNRLLGISSKVSPRAAMLNSPDEIKAMVDEEVALILAELSNPEEMNFLGGAA